MQKQICYYESAMSVFATNIWTSETGLLTYLFPMFPFDPLTIVFQIFQWMGRF